MYDQEYEEIEPDRSKSDFYCKVCHSHMNSFPIWQSHIAGKRHLKNMKKVAGETPSKVKNIKMEGERATIQDILDSCEGPLVGLSYVSERQASVKGGEVMFHCHLCQGGCTRINIEEHLRSYRHKLMFFKEKKPEIARSLDGMKHLSKGSIDCLLDDYAMEWERDYGRDLVQVELRKPPEWKPFSKKISTDSWNKMKSKGSAFSQPSMSSSELNQLISAATNVSDTKSQELTIQSLTMSEGKTNYQKFSLIDKFELINDLINNMSFDDKESRNKALKVYVELRKIHVLPKLRSLPGEAKKDVQVNFSGNAPSMRAVIDDVLQVNHPSFYFSGSSYFKTN